MTQTMNLVVGWTLVGAFAFTVIITCASLVGWVRFADESQQKKLFTAMILQLVVGLGATFLGVTRFDPNAVKDELIDTGNNQAILGILDEATSPGRAVDSQITKDQARILVDRLRVQHVPGLQEVQRDFAAKVRALPEGKLSPDSARELRPLVQRPTVEALRNR